MFMGSDGTKPVFGVSNTESFKPISLVIETSYKIEIFGSSKFTYGTFQKVKNKGADQTVRMHRLLCTCVVREPQKTGFLASRPI